MLKYSKRFTNETKRYNISVLERAMADMIMMGWDATEAFIATGQYKPTLADEWNKQQIDKIINDPNILTYMQSKQKAIRLGRFKKIPRSCDEKDDEQEEDVSGKYRSKDEILDALAAEAKFLKGKDKTDVLMKIADLQQMKKEETIEEDNTVHFYLPISCKSCSLYMKARKKSLPKVEDENKE